MRRQQSVLTNDDLCVSLNSFLPSEVENVWVPELTFANTEGKPATVVDEKTSISVQKKGKDVMVRFMHM